MKPSVKHLVSIVSDVSAIESGGVNNLFLAMVNRNVAIADAIDKVEQESAESSAISELLALIRTRSKATTLSDKLVCSGALHALGEFGSDARQAIPYLEELSNSGDEVWRSDASMSLAKIKGVQPTIRQKKTRS